MQAWRRFAAAALAAVLTACAVVPVPRNVSAPLRTVPSTIATGAGTVDATWFLPERAPNALIVMAPGFTRRCAHLRTTAMQLAAAGPMLVCIDAPMVGGNPRLAEALAAPVAQGLVAPDGTPAPLRVIVAGHSAGAVFALHLGARLADRAPERLAGALLFDPVATPDFETALRAVSDRGRRPLLAMLAAPHRCNALRSAGPALRRLQDEHRETVAVLDLGPDSTHLDIEGEDSDWLGIAVCGQPRPTQVTTWRQVASSWAQDVAEARAPARQWPSEARPLE